jgi:hypothetical protein
MLGPKETEELLGRLCVELGFCLPPEENQAIIDDPPATVSAFADAVVIAEGLKPDWLDVHLYRRIKTIVAEAFERSLEEEEIDHV